MVSPRTPRLKGNAMQRKFKARNPASKNIAKSNITKILENKKRLSRSAERFKILNKLIISTEGRSIINKLSSSVEGRKFLENLVGSEKGIRTLINLLGSVEGRKILNTGDLPTIKSFARNQKKKAKK